MCFIRQNLVYLILEVFLLELAVRPLWRQEWEEAPSWVGGECSESRLETTLFRKYCVYTLSKKN